MQDQTFEQGTGVGTEMVLDVQSQILLSKAELDQQIVTAKAHPRSVDKFRKELYALACSDIHTAEECIYAVPRAGKTIEGPSIRFAEIVAYCWTNAHLGGRVVEVGRDTIKAQGAFHDLERNVKVVREVERRITTKDNKRFGADMIATTGNAAISIGLRNAIFNGVPRALWWSMYLACRKVVAGEGQSFVNRRAEILARCQKIGAPLAKVLAKFGYNGIDDITMDDVIELAGICNAIRDNEINVDEAFAPQEETQEGAAAKPSTRAEQAKAAMSKTQTAQQEPTQQQQETQSGPADQKANQSGGADLFQGDPETTKPAADGKPTTVTKTGNGGGKKKPAEPEWTEATAIAKLKEQKTLAGLNNVWGHISAFWTDEPPVKVLDAYQERLDALGNQV